MEESVLVMSRKSTREHIVEVSDDLFYRQGYDHTSFADIADVVNISRGNFYYHFKTKDEILDAVIETRLENTRRMLEEWEKEGDTPLERIRCYIEIVIRNRAKIMHYGCPVGTLTTELAKLDHAAQRHASKIFSLFREWLARQFTLMGRDRDADALAMHVIAWSQGVATLDNAFQDEAFVHREVDHICRWLDAQAETPKS
jgi:AcrR family transcriptional regulator